MKSTSAHQSENKTCQSQSKDRMATFGNLVARSNSDTTIGRAQVRAARAMLEWSSESLAKHAGVHRRTVRKLERGDASPQRATVDRIAKALEAGGIEFLIDGGVRQKYQNGI